MEAEGEAQVRLRAIQRRSESLWKGLRPLAGISTLLQEPPAAGLVSITAHWANGDLIDPAWIVGRMGEQGIWLRTIYDPACVRARTLQREGIQRMVQRSPVAEGSKSGVRYESRKFL